MQSRRSSMPHDRKGSLQGGSVAITHAVLRFRQASHGRFFRLLGRRGLPKVLLITNLRGGRRRRRDCCRGILSMANSSVCAEMLLETFMLNAHLAILTFGPQSLGRGNDCGNGRCVTSIRGFNDMVRRGSNRFGWPAWLITYHRRGVGRSC